MGQTDPQDPRASPLYGDLAGLTPVMLLVGEDEILLDDARCMADRIATAGAVAELHVWQGWCTSSRPISPFCAPRPKRWIIATFLRNKLHG